MSTAGKVLSVVVTLALVLWIILAASVATLNTNGAKAVAANAETLANLETQLRETTVGLDRLRASVAAEQAVTSQEVTTIRIHLAETERRLADVRESLERVKLQVAIAEDAAQVAQANRDNRLEVRSQIQQELATNQSIVERLRGEDAELRQQRTELLDKLGSLLAENRELKGRIESRGGSTGSTRSARAVR